LTHSITIGHRLIVSSNYLAYTGFLKQQTATKLDKLKAHARE